MREWGGGEGDPGSTCTQAGGTVGEVGWVGRWWEFRANLIPGRMDGMDAGEGANGRQGELTRDPQNAPTLFLSIGCFLLGGPSFIQQLQLPRR